MLPSPVFLGFTITSIDWLGLLQLLLAGFVLVWLVTLAHVWHTLTHPPRLTYAWALAKNLPGSPRELNGGIHACNSRAFTEWTLETPAPLDPLPVWDIPGDNPAGPTVIITHGWGDSRIGQLIRLSPYLSFASRVLLWDLPGHGDAKSKSTALGRSESAALSRLIDQTDGPVVLVGHSMGAGISIETAAISPNSRIIGVVAESVYNLPGTPASRVLNARGLPNWGFVRSALAIIGGLHWQRTNGYFDRSRYARSLRVPLLLIHGEKDPVSPVEDARTLEQSTQQATLIVIPGGRHNDLWFNPSSRAACEAAVRAWVLSILKPPAN